MWSIEGWFEGWEPLQGFLLLYVDPGGGSVLLQTLIGTLLAIWFFLRTQKERVRRFLQSRFSRGDVERDQRQETG